MRTWPARTSAASVPTPLCRPLFALCLLGASAWAAPVELARFPLLRDAQPPASAGADVAAFTFDADLFAGLDDRMTNLRLFDDTGREQPFLIRPLVALKTVSTERDFSVPSPATSFRQLPDNRIEFTVARDPRQPPASGLRLESGIRNFEKVVTVSGSSDGQHWTVLAAGAPIYDYSRFVDVRQDTVHFPASSATQFRLELSNVTENKDSPLVEIIRQTRGARESNEVEATSFRKEPFRIERIVFIERVTETARRGEPETGEFTVSGWTVTSDPKQQQTLVEFSTRRQPLIALALRTDDLNFNRRATVEACDTDPLQWRSVAGGSIGRIHAGLIRQDGLAIRFPSECRARRYRVSIANEDNPPLSITGLDATENRYEALFFPKAGQRYRVAYGGDDIPAPRYDIGAVLAACPAETAGRWTLGPEATNAVFNPRLRGPATGGKVVLTAAIAAMVLVLAVLIASLARKVGAEPPVEPGA